MEALFDYPFAGTFVGFLSQGDPDVKIGILHHCFKLIPAGIPFQPEDHAAFGLAGLGRGAKVTAFPPAILETNPEGLDPERTPTLLDFFDAAGDQQKTDALKRVHRILKADKARGSLEGGHPLPQAFARKFGGMVPPFLMNAFASKSPKKILFDYLSALKEFTNLQTKEKETELWAACFPVMQRIWILSRAEKLSDEMLSALVMEDWPSADGDGERKKAAAIEMEFLAPKDDEQDGDEESQEEGASTGATPRSARGSDVRTKLLEDLIIQSASNNAKLTRLITDGGGSGHAGDQSDGKGWKKRFPPMQQKFILFASAVDKNSVPEEPCQEYKNLLEAPKAQANSLLKFGVSKRNGTQVVDSAMSAQVYNMSFFGGSQSSENPDGLSLFYAVPAQIIGGSADMGAEELEMRLKTNNLSASQIQKLTSSKVQVAKDEHGLQATVRNHLCLLASIFGEDAFCYSAITKLKIAMSKAEPEFACMAAKERTFLASFMRTVDLKLGHFLHSCANAETIADVDFEALNFEADIRDVAFQRVTTVVLPTLVAQLIAPVKDNGNGDRKPAAAKRPGADTSNKKERGKRSKTDAADAVQNASPVDKAWYLSDKESYGAFHKHMKDIPKFKGTAICAKYHLKGSCDFGDKCSRKATHTGSFDAATKAAFGAWVSKCRSEESG